MFHMTDRDIFTPAGNSWQGMLHLIRREWIGDRPSTTDIKTSIMTQDHILVVKVVIYRLTTICSYEVIHQEGSQSESREIIAIIAILLVIFMIPVIIITIMIIIAIMIIIVITMTIFVIITAIMRTVTIITIIMQAMILTIFNLEESEKNLTGVTMWWETSLHPLAIDRNRTLTKETGVKKLAVIKFMDTTDRLIAKRSVFIFDNEKKVYYHFKYLWGNWYSLSWKYKESIPLKRTKYPENA